MSGLPPADPDLMGDVWDDDWDPRAASEGGPSWLLMMLLLQFVFVLGAMFMFLAERVR